MSRTTKESRSFLDLYLNGEALAEEIDDFVDRWHSNPGQSEIYDFLGMSKQEYSLWLRDPDSLPHIARARRSNLPLRVVVEMEVNGLPLAARGADAPKVKRLLQWLERQGKIY